MNEESGGVPGKRINVIGTSFEIQPTAITFLKSSPYCAVLIDAVLTRPIASDPSKLRFSLTLHGTGANAQGYRAENALLQLPVQD